ncbi:hypothetical protein TNCV_3896591 [Trichonephila clavipes]|nr:hypothetical protein TNCV_3896591 [Trichonephila clavipes]
MSDNKKHENKETRKSISLETKMQEIRRLDTDERQSQIGAALNLATSTIRTILNYCHMQLQQRQAQQQELSDLEIIQKRK